MPGKPRPGTFARAVRRWGGPPRPAPHKPRGRGVCRGLPGPEPSLPQLSALRMRGHSRRAARGVEYDAFRLRSAAIESEVVVHVGGAGGPSEPLPAVRTSSADGLLPVRIAGPCAPKADGYRPPPTSPKLRTPALDDPNTC